ncbi:MAG: hypothetical protein C0621_03595 [Desulfuromonas sp.]|nr:MAG: hypothetical protein C0621_03595 [Desulfuromonas sp.]
MSTKILIAEDNEQIAAALSSLIEKHGYQPLLAHDGIEALQSVIANTPDLLLLDLKLPRLHGVDLLKKLRQSPKTQNLPVVVMSGLYKGDKYVAAAKSLGVEIYLEKPFRAAQLIEALQASLPSKEPAPPVAKPADLTGGATALAPSTTTAMSHPATTFDRHLLRLFTQRFTGLCTLHEGEKTHQLFCLGGIPVALAPGFSYSNLGDYLQAQGALSPEEFNYFTHDGEKRGESLVQLGCLEHPDLLQTHLSYLVNELIAACGRPAMTASETPLPLPQGLQPLAVNVPMILYQGYHRYPKLAATGMPADLGRRYFAPSPTFFRYINFFSLAPAEQQLLHLCDGSRPLSECGEGDTPQALIKTLRMLDMFTVGSAPLQGAAPDNLPVRTFFNAVEEEPETLAEEALESFSDLVDDSDLSLAAELPGAAAAQTAPISTVENPLEKKVRQYASDLEGKNYYELFNLKQGDFSFDRLKERYFAITREFGPDVLMQLGGAEAQKVEEILSTVATAYNTLSDMVKKERYDELLNSERVGLGEKGDDIFQAQVQAQSGKVFLEMEEWDNAEKALQDACNIDSNNGDYLAHLAWAVYRNPSYTNSRAMLDKARQMLNRAISMERTAAAFAFKGWMLFEAGQDNLAESEFGKALRQDARNTLARKGMRTLQEKREQEKKGLFRRMFR